MAGKLSMGRIVILGMFAAAAIYAGTLVLLNEPTPWRDIPPEGMSRNGLAYSDEIAEMKLYYMPRRSFPFFFADERAHYQPLARVTDPARIKQILDVLQPGTPEAEPGCAAIRRDAMLHVITYRADGSVFGYVVLQAGRITAAGPQDAKGCTLAWLQHGDKLTSWPLYDARARVSEITGVRM
jgi:hypothetical protein